MTILNGLLLLCVAGCAVAHDDVTVAQATSGQVRHVGHIYFNLATGERITTLMTDDAEMPRVEEGGEIWVSDNREQCGFVGNTTTYWFGVDSVTGPYMTIPGNESILYDWGDIQSNTIVDCVQVHWITNHADTDVNDDGVGDGVVGFGATWTFWDGMNGRSPQFESIALPIISFRLENLPGEISDPGDSLVSFYTADIDLLSTPKNSLTFEIGDTNGDLAGADFHNPDMDLADRDGDGIPDVDPDQDGLADWGWSIDFHQPGTVDFDNADMDSDSTTGVDGDPNAWATAGVVLGSPSPGHAEFDSESGEWVYVADGLTAGPVEDLFRLYSQTHDTVYVGNFGGFECMPDGIFYTPAAHFMVTLYGPTDVGFCLSISDLNGDNSHDFLDIQIFTTQQVDLNGDGFFDFLDIQLFTQSFIECSNSKP